MRNIGLWLLVSLLPWGLWAQTSEVADRSLELIPDPQACGVFATGSVELAATLSAETECECVTRLQIHTDKGAMICDFSRDFTLEAGVQERLRLELDLAPGFYRATLELNGEPSRSWNFGVQPERILSEPDRQADFDDFWAQALEELAAVKPHYTLKRLKEHSTAKRNFYLVTMRSTDGELLQGYYLEPVAEGCYPATITFLGYNSDQWMPSADANPERVEFYLSHRGQGLNKPTNRYGDWVVSGLEEPERYYYRGAYVDGVRGVDFLMTRKRVDKRLIFAEGGSQGGALTLALCALDKRVAAAAPFVPFMSDFVDYLELAPWPANALLPAAEELGLTREELLKTLSYVDIKNLADRITCPILMGFGLQDEVCPPHTNFAGYNQLQGPKQWMVFPMRGHDVHNEPTWYEARDRFFEAVRRQVLQGNEPTTPPDTTTIN